MYPIQLIPVTKDYVWGGVKLKDQWKKSSIGGVIAESWELSCHRDGESVVSDGEYEGMTLRAVVETHPEYLGTAASRFPFFPILIKLIDAEQNLSIQVHPDDAYALAHEGQFGKSEMWYIVDCDEGSGVYCGFRKPLDKAQVAKHLQEGTICDALNFIQVKKGDCLYIPAGTVHAICGGLLICEIQQNSSLTYRLFDYNRKDQNGNLRALHIDKAIDVIDASKVSVPNAECKRLDDHTRLLAQCDYFTAKEIKPEGEYVFDVTNDSFVSLTVVEGRGRVAAGGSEVECDLGDTVFLPAGIGETVLTGDMTVIAASV